MRFPILTGPQTPAQFERRFEMGVHEGIDVFAPAGAELVAIEAGKVRQSSNPKGGHVVYLTTDDGTRYYYAHLDAFAYPLMPGETRQVEAGDSLGYVGTSGNARGKAPHLHLEIRPRGGDKVDPYPLLTRLAKREELRVVVSPQRPKKPKKRKPKPVPVAPPRVPRAAPGGSDWGVAAAVFLVAWAVGASERKSAHG